MKRPFFACILVLPLLLGACQSVSFTQASFDRIVGEWTVDKGTRPSGWHDAGYSFTAEREFRIFYDDLDPYTGTVLGVDKSSIQVEGTTNPNKSPETMTMCYILDAAGTSMQLGWYDGIVRRYYLKLTKQ